MIKKPWFSIIDVTEKRGRSMADIAAEVAREHRVSLTELRGERHLKYVCAARMEAMVKVRAERPDLSSAQVAAYFNRDPSTVRHTWRKAEAQAA